MCLAAAFLPRGAEAQVVLDFSRIESTQNVDVRMTLRDAQTKDPVQFATVYLVPQNDTVITDFAISDDKGEVLMEDVIPGRYTVNAEMIGYVPYSRSHNIKGWEMNLGMIEMRQSREIIDAATITAIGNAISVQGDTLTYNASSFRVGENAMLEDLLKKMPGMEVSQDGTVTVNGERVDKITVGGKTFFFNDPAMAVKNLPAQVVDKIKVIDKKKEEAEFTGVSTIDEKEKVMDVELKEQYRRGWFGNAKVNGGTTAGKADDDWLNDFSGALYNGNAMAAFYDEKDQVTLLGSGGNADEPGAHRMIVVSDMLSMDEFDMKMGLTTSAQAGADYNTERIRGMETDASVSYNFSSKDAREESVRTSFQSDGNDISTASSYKGLGTGRRIGANFYSTTRDNGKYMLTIAPTFQYTLKSRVEESLSSTGREGVGMNSSTSSKSSDAGVFNTRTEWQSGIKDLGKERRSITFNGNFTYRNSDGSSAEMSRTDYDTFSDIRNLLYENKMNYIGTEGVLSYVEPLGKLWSLQTRFTACYISQSDSRSAFNGDDGSANDHYSSLSGNRDLLFRERLLAQYSKEKTTAVFGLQVDQERNVVHSRNMGIENTVGEGQWAVNFAPYADVRISSDNRSFDFTARGNTDTPMGRVIVPALDISDPVSVRAGNIFLKTGFRESMSFHYRASNPRKMSFFNVTVFGDVNANSTVSAIWFDDNGVRYDIPVNSKSPGYSVTSYLQFRHPLNRSKTLTISVQPYVSYSGNTSYQAKTRLPGLDKDNFNYAEMMAGFWGGPDGDIFYSGRSGFARSSTRTLDYSLDVELEFNGGDFSFDAGTVADNTISRYSLDPTADNNVWEFYTYGEFLWSDEKGWEVNSRFDVSFFRGYTDGYGKPVYNWDAKVSKAVGPVTFSLGVSDILNSRRSVSRNTSAEYMQDIRRNVMGRYVMLGISFSFGRMNAGNNAKAQSAMWQMML